METDAQAGKAMHSDNAADRKQAAAVMGAARTERKSSASRENIKVATEARRGKPMSEEHKAKIAATRQAQEAARKQAAPVEGAEKKGPGRPRKEAPGVKAANVVPNEEAGAKRGRGRPKKQDGQTAAQSAAASQKGAGEAGTA